MFQRSTYKYEMVSLGLTIQSWSGVEGLLVQTQLTHLFPFHQINKQNEQMHGLLAIALTMYPMRIDESIHTQLREKYGDKMLRMQKG